MSTLSSVGLALSLVFAVAQIVAGTAVVRWLTHRGLWRRIDMFFLLLLSLWFVCSGVTELFVSGMEVLHAVRGEPGAAAFALWRARADTFLFAATGALALCLLVFMLAAAWTRKRLTSGR